MVDEDGRGTPSFMRSPLPRPSWLLLSLACLITHLRCLPTPTRALSVPLGPSVGLWVPRGQEQPEVWVTEPKSPPPPAQNLDSKPLCSPAVLPREAGIL